MIFPNRAPPTLIHSPDDKSECGNESVPSSSTMTRQPFGIFSARSFRLEVPGPHRRPDPEDRKRLGYGNSLMTLFGFRSLLRFFDCNAAFPVTRLAG